MDLAASRTLRGLAALSGLALCACAGEGTEPVAPSAALDGALDAAVDAAPGVARDATFDAVADSAGDARSGPPMPSDGAFVDANPASPDAGPPGRCRNPGTAGATAACLSPELPPEHYVDQALRYFDTLDVDADRERVPDYSELVARWEWPPWLLLTGYGRDVMNETATFLRDFDPSTVPERDCRFFDTQPFARCYVIFEYEGGPCPIYEEFVFNAAGAVTFIEAWSDLPGLRPMDAEDRWAESDGVLRLSTRIPGLGDEEGRIDLEGPWMITAAAQDRDVEDFVRRAQDFWGTWLAELQGAEEDFFARGCGW